MDERPPTKERIQRVAKALRFAMEDGYRDVIVLGHDADHQFVHLEVTPGFTTAHAPARDDSDALVALGWRRPSGEDSRFLQYLYPQRPRDLKAVARWVTSTLVDGLGAEPDFIILNRERTDRPGFAHNEAVATAWDSQLADTAEQVLTGGPFEVRREGTHLDLVSIRRRHLAQLGVSFIDGTLSVHVLHLVEPGPAVVAAHLAANAAMGHSPFVYAERSLADGRHTLVLESKAKALGFATAPPAMGGMLRHLIEPMLDAHRELHASRR